MLYKEFLHRLEGCPFCEGANRIIVEKQEAYLTYALAPYHKHHLLILPKRHAESISDISESEKEDIESLQEIGLALLKKLGYSSISLLVKEGKIGTNKTIDHVHYHVIPKIQIGDLDHYGEERTILEPEQIEETLNDIEALLS